ncbi:MAG: MFS transporter [Deltaproteobacteria bacterium]|nr:MFS transporter [Deltaproteobacteria bacterium]
MQGSVRLYFRVCLQGFFFWLAYDLSRFPVIPLYAQKLGLPPEAIGFAVAASTMTGIFGKMISGALSDSVGRKIMMVIACVVATVLPTLYFLADSASSLIMIRLFHGLGTAIMGPVGRAFVADIVPETKRGNWLSTYTSSTNLGTMAGRSLAGFFLYWGGFFYPFAASAVAGLIALGIALRWPDDRRHPFELRPLLRRMGQGFREGAAGVADRASVWCPDGDDTSFKTVHGPPLRPIRPKTADYSGAHLRRACPLENSLGDDIFFPRASRHSVRDRGCVDDLRDCRPDYRSLQ